MHEVHVFGPQSEALLECPLLLLQLRYLLRKLADGSVALRPLASLVLRPDICFLSLRPNVQSIVSGGLTLKDIVERPVGG